MKFYICDDSEKDLATYEKKLMDLALQYNIELEVSTFTSGEQMLFQLSDEIELIDAIYLDINMPKTNGIEVAKELLKMNFPGELIFLTVSEEHFIPAFDVGAFNYLVKNHRNKDRFELVFLRAIREIEDKHKEYIVLIAAGEHKKINTSDIDYFEVHRKLVTVYYNEGEEFEFTSPLGKVESHLDGKGFIRIHRGILVNVKAIKTFGYGEIELNNGKKLPVGRTYQTEVTATLKKYHGKIIR